MSKTSMSIRLDSEVKEQAQLVFNHLGMDMTTAINIFLRQAIQMADSYSDFALHPLGLGATSHDRQI